MSGCSTRWPPRAVRCPARSCRGWGRRSRRCPRRWCWCWMTCTCCMTGSAGRRCRCWPITCRTARGWCSRAGPSRRCGSRGCAPRAGLLEIGPGDLSLTAEEASLLLRNAGLTLGEEDVAALQQRTEGSPAGLYLAALYLREGGPLATAAVSFGGDGPAGERVRGVGVPGADLPPAAAVPDPDRGAGADVRAAVRCGARAEGVGHGPGGPGTVEPAAGAAGPAAGSGSATTTCSATCSWPSCTAWSPS